MINLSHGTIQEVATRLNIAHSTARYRIHFGDPDAVAVATEIEERKAKERENLANLSKITNPKTTAL